MQGSVAEWSKALVLGTSHFGGVGSNPTTIKLFTFRRNVSLVCYQFCGVNGLSFYIYIYKGRPEALCNFLFYGSYFGQLQ